MMLTLREAFTEYYHVSELSPRTVNTMRLAIGCWERLTGDPPLATVDNAVVEEFRKAALASGLSPRTTNGYWSSIRTIFRRVGPIVSGSPWSLGLIDHVPAMRPCKVDFKRPERLTMDQLDRLYLASGKMTEPYRRVADPPLWWRSLAAFCYFTALRSADVLRVTWEAVDFSRSTMFIKVQKTGVSCDLPLHPVLVDHLHRLKAASTSDRLFDCGRQHFYEKLLPRWRAATGVGFAGLHSFRRTAASELDAVSRGMGSVILLHKPVGVAAKSYLDLTPELADAINRMAVPLSFKHGIRMVDRSVRETKREMSLRPQDFAVPVSPPPGAFQFAPDGYFANGRHVRLQSGPLAILRLLADSGGEVEADAAWRTLGHSGAIDRDCLYGHIHRLRRSLRSALRLPRGFNPVPGRYSAQDSRTATVTHYVLVLPPALWTDPTRRDTGHPPDAA